MHFAPALALLAWLATLAAAQDPCWTDDQAKTTCRWYFADSVNATLAIANACSKMACTPGTTPSPNKVQGSILGFPYTAVLRVGNKCAGLDTWTTDGCVALFQTYLYPRCKTNDTLLDPEHPPVPPNDYPLASKSSTCDDSSLNFNFGG